MKEQFPIKILDKIDADYLGIVYPILCNEEFIKRKFYHHHENRSVYGHSLLVSLYSYKLAKYLGLDYKSVAIGGLLHDFYYNDWQLAKKNKNILKAHGFVHATEALENAKLNFPFLINKKVENIILRHMFPLNFIPPRYLESWLISLVDKYCSLEIFKNPFKLHNYIGLRG